MTKYFVDANGNYLGGFDGYQPPDKVVVDAVTDEKTIVPQPFVMPAIPAGAVEIPNPPEHGLDKWINGAWVPNKDRLNAPIKEKIAALDMKRIRPLAEGNTAYLANLNTQIVALRSKLT